MSEHHVPRHGSGIAGEARPGKPVRAIRPEDLDRPHPLYCVWEITLACDLGCKHCGSRAGKARDGELTTEQCMDVIDQLAEVGVREVTLIGGEAYLREDWLELVRAITERGMACSMATGGRNLTAERVAAAKDAGMVAISLSIDGLEQTHDRLRGPKGSWRAAVEAAERVAKAGIRLQANTQINRLSMPELPALADLLGDLGARGWQIQLTTPMGRAADRPNLLLQPHELLELFPLLVWIKRTKCDPMGIGVGASNNIGYFGPYERLLRPGADDGAHWSSCNAGKWSLGLEADGKIKGCPSLPSTPYTGGNLKTDRLADVIEHAPQVNHLRKRTVEDLWGYCRTCYYAEVCKGGCTWMAHTLFGKSGNNPYCIHRAMQLEQQGLRERVEKVAEADGLPFDYARFEIVVEPMPDAPGTPSILGMALGEVTSLGFESGSAWSADGLKQVLRKA